MQVLYFEIQKIIDNARVMSDYRSKTEIDHGEQTIIPSINIVDGPVAKKLLEDGAAGIAGMMSGYFHGLKDGDGNALEGYEYDTAYEDTDGCIVYRLNMPLSFDQRLLGPLKRAVRGGLENYVLSRFADLTGFSSEQYEQHYRSELDKIRSYLSRRTTTIKRTYKLF